MKKLTPVLFVFLICLLACKNNQKVSDNKSSTNFEDNHSGEQQEEKIDQAQYINYGKLDDSLIKLIKKVVIEFPLENIEEKPENVQQSYYVGFFKVENDTLIAICRQPFIMEVFPDFAFEKKEIPKEKPTYIGMVEDADLPIFVFDSGGVGNGFYKNASIVKEYPERYDTGEDKSHTPEIPPIFKYKLREGKFKFLGKSKSQWID